MNRFHNLSPITCQPFSCQRENLTIRGHIYRKEAGILPAIIICHGFMANQKTVKHYAEFLANLGWSAFIFDFCGGGIKSTSDGKQEEMSVLTEVEDLKAVIQYVKQRDDVVKERVSIMGCSQGGLVCALTASQLKDEIESLILFYPAFCIPDHARRGKMMFAKFDPNNIPPIISQFPMKLGDIYVKDVINMNVYDEIKGYDGPVLIIHGTNDRIVDISYSRKARQIYKNCHYAELEGAGHIFRGDDDIKAMEVSKGLLINKTCKSEKY